MQKINKSIVSFVWSLFLSGFLTIAPIALTIVIFTISFRLVIGWLEPIARLKPTFLESIPHAEILLAFLFIVIIGAIVQLIILNPLLHAFDRLIDKVPLVSPVYSGIKQLVHAFSAQDHTSFKRVVYVQFPHPGTYSVGFMTNEIPGNLAPSTDKKFFTIFVPITPNPTHGFLIVASEDMLIDSNLTRKEAMSLIISAGIIQLDRTPQK